MPVRLL